MFQLIRFLISASLILLTACSSPRVKQEEPFESAPSSAATARSQARQPSRGLASWYGRKLNGRRTASGERFNMKAFTAAHPSLPFGSMVEVTDLKSGKKVKVRINDRGPHSQGRIIDLSYAAARELGILANGVATVEIREIAGE